MSLLTQASLVVTPNGYKEGTLYSVVPNNSNGDFSVTRATTATRVNAAGLVELVPYNLVQYSEQFNQTTWFKNNLTITTNTIAAPNGALTADTATATATGNCNIQLGITPGGTCTQSYYVKKNTARYAYIFRNSGTTAGFIYDFDTNTITFSAGGGSAFTATPVGDGWVRLAHSVDMTFSGTMDIGFSSNPTNRTINSGESGYLWGAQLVQGTSALDYQATETRLNIPRLDYSLGSCPNILLEPQRTNLMLRSEEFDNASWVKTAINVTANTTTSPSGIVNADTLTADGTSSFHQAAQLVSGVLNTTYTFSVYAKKNTNNFIQLIPQGAIGGTNLWANFDLNNGVVGSTGSLTTASITSVGNGWYRCSITGAAVATIIGTFSVLIPTSATAARGEVNTLTTSVFVWGAQFEAGAYATSYIPTTSASVTRNLDDITRGNVFTNNLITAAGGTWFVDVRDNRSLARENFTGGIFLNTGIVSNQNNGFLFRASASPDRIGINKVVGSTVTLLHQLTTDSAKVAIKWNGTTADVFVNGVKVLTATSFTTTAMQNLIANGFNRAIQINSMALFPTPLTDTQCIALTT